VNAGASGERLDAPRVGEIVNWSGLDYGIAFIVAFSVLMSFLRGLTRELISLTASIGGVVAALWCYDDLAPWFEPHVKSREVAQLAAFVTIVVAALVAGSIVSAIVGRVVKAAGLRGADRLLGASFGLLKGLLLSLALVLALVAFAPGREIADRSRLAPYLVQGSRALAVAAPAGMQARFWEGLERARKIWQSRSGSSKTL
jgi:membrane protein required for colicin V production